MRAFFNTAAVLAIIAAAPCLSPNLASAQPQARAWRLEPRVQREIQGDVRSLHQQIARAADRRAISPRDARALRKEASSLQRDLDRASRNGLDRREVQRLESGVNRLRARLKLERRSWLRR